MKTNPPEVNRQPATPLRVHRVARNLNQMELAQLAGVTRETIVALEARRHRPHRLTAAALAAALGIDVEALFPHEESE